jgi:hypothetical protein
MQKREPEISVDDRVDQIQEIQEMQTLLIGVKRSLHFTFYDGNWSCELFWCRDQPSLMTHEEAVSLEVLLDKLETRLKRRLAVYDLESGQAAPE